jgi:hypothetical protein
MSFIKNPDQPHLPVCQNLRTKASYIPDLRDEFYMEMHHPYSQYFCLKTLHAVGPDDDVVCPEDCGTHRRCFESLLSDMPMAGSDAQEDGADKV